VTHTC